jgi:diadenosine tetraphosphate (Ap4A) HIT family hydrolase
MFALHPTLVKDTLEIGDLPLCKILLMNNRHFPWLILVPKRQGLRELFDLHDSDYNNVMHEVRHVAKLFSDITHADKINTAALGNMVEQLHIHIIARFKNDIAWPNPVWNFNVPAELYNENEHRQWTENLRSILDNLNITKM